MFGNPKHILYLDTDTLVNRPLIDVFRMTLEKMMYSLLFWTPLR